MTAPTAERLFFVHLMKTGGTTFRHLILANHAADTVYPQAGVDPDEAAPYRDIAYLLDLPGDRQTRIRAYSGHFPFWVTSRLGPGVVTATLVREPVARTLSYLRSAADANPAFRGWPIEDIYADRRAASMFIRNHQTRMFALSEDDGALSFLQPIRVDARRLSAAKSNLDAVDAVGVTHRFDDFVRLVADRLAWTVREVDAMRVGGDPADVPDGLVEQIRQDNRADLALYAHALDRVRG